MMFCGTLHE
jgi:hypothetical protein